MESERWMRAPWSWRANASWWSAWRGRGSRRRGSSRGAGRTVVATDRKPAGELPAEVLSLEDEGVRLELGGHRAETFTGAALVVVSPGVPWDAAGAAGARARRACP